MVRRLPTINVCIFMQRIMIPVIIKIDRIHACLEHGQRVYSETDLSHLITSTAERPGAKKTNGASSSTNSIGSGPGKVLRG